jgi:hypothetical protein
MIALPFLKDALLLLYLALELQNCLLPYILLGVQARYRIMDPFREDIVKGLQLCRR